MDIDQLKNLHVDRLDLGLLFGNLRTYASFAESSLDGRRRFKEQKLARDINTGQIEPEDINRAQEEHEEEFDVILPSAIQYSGIVLLIAYVEWFLKFCERDWEAKGWTPPPRGKSDGKKTLITIKWLAGQNGGFTHPFEVTLERLIVLRNCIVHDAAMVTSDEQRNAIGALPGFAVGRYITLRNLIVIQPGTIAGLIDQAEEWIDALLDHLGIGSRFPKSI